MLAVFMSAKKLFMNIRLLLILFTIFGALIGCEAKRDERVYSGPTMGTEYRITIIEQRGVNANAEQVQSIIDSALDRVNQSMSTYIPNSEISSFNKLTVGESVSLSNDMLRVVEEAQQISELSGGAFDPTLGKAIRLWGFGEDGRITQQPSEKTLEELRDSVGYQKLELKGRRLTKSVDGLELNLSAIAKGYAVDVIAEELLALGYRDFLVNIGGELRASGRNIEGKLWRVGVEKPHLLGGIEQVVTLNNKAIATSGDYRNFIVIDDQPFSHTIDPSTLKPVLHSLASVSVIADQASTADAIATALLSMGDKKGIAFAKEHEMAAYFIIRNQTKDDYTIFVTENFKVNLPQ